MASDNIFFKQRLVAGHAAVAEAGEINGVVGTMDDEFGDGIARRRTLLQAMAGKTIAT